MRGYLRLGAKVCGEPAHDPDFGVGDFPALLDKRHADVRYLRRLRSVASGRSRSGAPDEQPRPHRQPLAAAGVLRRRLHRSRHRRDVGSGDRGAAHGRAHRMRVLLLPALPLLAVPLPGRSRVQRVYCRLMLRCLGVRITLVRRPDSQPERCAGGQRARVVGGHLHHRLGAAGLVRRASRPDRLARARVPRAPDEGHPDRAVQPASAARRGAHRRRPAARRAHRRRVPRGHHVVRPRLRQVPARDVPGRDRRRSARAAAAADLSPPRRPPVDGSRVHRRRLTAGVGAAGHHRHG